MIGQVSGEDAKPSGQRVTERGRLSHPADLAKTDETISEPRPGQFFNPACVCPQHLKAELTFHSERKPQLGNVLTFLKHVRCGCSGGNADAFED